MTLEHGAILNKRYRIVNILGQGGMGAVYRAIDMNLGMDVAVKENLFTTKEFARQFHREAIILASLRHPNLPRVTDHFVIDGQGQYLVMDYIEGEDLRERMERCGNLKDTEVVVLGVALCDALSYLHSRQPQVLHRDIKPGNVKITPDGNICLVDFGLAKIVEREQITTTGARAMTPGYSPPEQYGTARTDQRTDIYSLGATLYVALTSVIPEDALARVMGQAELVPIRKNNPKVPRRIGSAIEKSMSLRPGDRYQSVEQFKNALLNSRVTDGIQLDELVLSPPPREGQRERLSGMESIKPQTYAGEGVPASTPDSLNSSLLPVSSPLAEPLISDVEIKRRTHKGLFAISLLIFILVFLGGTWIYISQPDIAKAALAWIPPLTNGGITRGAQMESDTEIVSLPLTYTSTLTVTPTHSQTLEVTETPMNNLETSTIMAVVGESSPTPTPSPTQIPTATATPMGGGIGQIAFASNQTGIPQIWVVNVDGTSQLQITDMPEGACQPDWSPDGRRLVFISPCASNQEIYLGASLFIINADGSELTPLPTIPGGDFDPAWSPDGEKIAFTSLRDYNRPQIYVIHLEDFSVQPVSNNLVRDMQPAWSPDGEKIVFISTRRGPSQVWTMNIDGSGAILFSRSGDKKNSRPVWSPNGQVILFTQSEVFGGVPRLIAVRTVEGTPVENRVVRDATPMREAVYSPDGYWIAYEGWPEGASHNIYIMTANGLARMQLTSEIGYDFDPAWRPAQNDSSSTD